MDSYTPSTGAASHTEVNFGVDPVRSGPSNPAPNQYGTTTSGYGASQGGGMPMPQTSYKQDEPEAMGPPPWVPFVLRPLQIVFSIATFGVMAAASYGSVANSSNTGSAGFCSNSSICNGRSFYNYSSYTFLVAVTVMSFIYSLFMLLLNLCKVGRRSGTHARTCMPTTALLSDTFFVFMIFGAACAASALTTGLNELQPGFCNYLSSSFCQRVTASPVLGFLTWFLYIPSFYFNMLQMNSEGPW